MSSATVQDHLVNCHIFKGVELVAWRGCLSTAAQGRPHGHLVLLCSCHGHRTSGPAAQSGPEQGCLWVPRISSLVPALSCMFPHCEHPGVGRGLDTPA